MNQSNNNETKYQPNVATYLSKYLLGAPLSNEEISAIAALSEFEERDIIISITSEKLRFIDDLSLLATIAAHIFGQISTDNMGYNIDTNIRQTTFQLNSQKIKFEREKQNQKGISR